VIIGDHVCSAPCLPWCVYADHAEAGVAAAKSGALNRSAGGLSGGSAAAPTSILCAAVSLHGGSDDGAAHGTHHQHKATGTKVTQMFATLESKYSDMSKASSLRSRRTNQMRGLRPTGPQPNMQVGGTGIGPLNDSNTSTSLANMAANSNTVGSGGGGGAGTLTREERRQLQAVNALNDPTVKKWERILATEVSNLVLDVFGDIILPTVQPSLSKSLRMQDKLLGFLFLFMITRQSDSVLIRVFQTYSTLLDKFGSLLWSKVRFLTREICHRLCSTGV